MLPRRININLSDIDYERVGSLVHHRVYIILRGFAIRIVFLYIILIYPTDVVLLRVVRVSSSSYLIPKTTYCFRLGSITTKWVFNCFKQSIAKKVTSYINQCVAKFIGQILCLMMVSWSFLALFTNKLTGLGVLQEASESLDLLPGPNDRGGGQSQPQTAKNH